MILLNCTQRNDDEQNAFVVVKKTGRHVFWLTRITVTLHFGSGHFRKIWRWFLRKTDFITGIDISGLGLKGFFVMLSNFRHKGTSGSEWMAFDRTEKQSMNRKLSKKENSYFWDTTHDISWYMMTFCHENKKNFISV